MLIAIKPLLKHNQQAGKTRKGENLHEFIDSNQESHELPTGRRVTSRPEFSPSVSKENYFMKDYAYLWI